MLQTLERFVKIWLPILTVVGGFLTYFTQLYQAREAERQRARIEQTRFETQQLQLEIERKIESYTQLIKALDDLRETWYLLQTRCHYHNSYAKNPSEIENGFEMRLRDEFKIINIGNIIIFYFGKEIAHELASYVASDYNVKNACSKKAPSNLERREKEAKIVDKLSAQIEHDQNRLKSLQRYISEN